MTRVLSLVTLILALLAAPLAAEAQPAGKVYRIGWLWFGKSGPSAESTRSARGCAATTMRRGRTS